MNKEKLRQELEIIKLTLDSPSVNSDLRIMLVRLLCVVQAILEP